jgi:hypothetical protein
MTLIIQKPTGAKLVFAQTNNGITDPEAIIYISNVEQADGQPLEYDTAKAIHDFVAGCKTDGIWTAIKASCILAGARTLAGSLVPLMGTAPTNVGGLFVSGDYNRKTGLVGNGSTKRLNSNRNNNADPQNSKHLSVFVSSLPTTASRPLAGQSRATTQGASFIYNNITRLMDNASASYSAVAGFVGTNRAASDQYIRRNDGANATIAENSSTPAAGDIEFYWDSGGSGVHSDARLAFYSIGESLDLALLDARVTTLINAFAAAIP